MNILVVGGSKAGAWEMRGVQLGAALGARVTSTPSPADFAWADVVVLVKRAGVTYAAQVHQAGKPLVWDALDCWRQPADNQMPEAQARQLLQNQIRAIRPTLTIGATQAQADAAGGVYLPHHCWAGLVPTPAREQVQIVAYQGNPIYLGRWQAAINTECAKRGWQFVINPADLSQADILVAFRDGPWDGWMCWTWKSGVKYVNAIAAGRPVVGQDCAALIELGADSVVVGNPSRLELALQDASLYQYRKLVAEDALTRYKAFTLPQVSARYHQILEEKVLACAA